jgi:hypothetical protein
MPLQFSGKGMKPPAGDVHFFRGTDGIERFELASQLRGMLWLDTCL